MDFAELQLGTHGLFWNEYRPEDAACRIWHWRDGVAKCLTPAGFSVRSRVYEYGGGAFCLTPEGWFSSMRQTSSCIGRHWRACLRR